MPGLVGLISSMPRHLAERELARMMRVIVHEPFYVSGTHVDEVLGVYVGWADRKGSFCSRLPTRNGEGDAAIFFCGEEFSRLSSPSVAPDRNECLRERGSSRVLDCYEHEANFPSSLNGRFHGLVVDERRKKIILFNDRYGLQRLYYHGAADGFYFAAEAKAILAVRPECRRLEARSLGELITCGCVLENRSLFAGIGVLPAASAWLFEKDKLPRRTTYFEPGEWEKQSELPPEEYYQQLKEVFTRSLPHYFSGSEGIAMSLTGGLDTRMIMAWQTAERGSLPCYSFGGMYRDCQDVVIARRVAEACGQTHQVIPVGREFLSKFLHYAERSVYLTDGCIDVSHSPDLYANERAAKIAPVRMTGNYGGEVLRRVRAFKPTSLAPELFADELRVHFEAAKQTYNSTVQAHPLSFALFRQAPWHHYGLLALEQTQVSVRSPFLDNDLVRTIYRAPRSSYETNDISMRLIAEGDPRVAGIRTDRGYLPGRDGLILRALQGFIEFTVKAEYAYDYGMPQTLARLDGAFSWLHLEQLFIGRHKFYHFRLWYRDILAKGVKDVLLDPRSLARPHVQKKTVEQIVDRHVTGRGNYTLEINKLLTLEFIHRLFLDASSEVDTSERELILAANREGSRP